MVHLIRMLEQEKQELLGETEGLIAQVGVIIIIGVVSVVSLYNCVYYCDTLDTLDTIILTTTIHLPHR
jgi:hypothetical protein